MLRDCANPGSGYQTPPNLYITVLHFSMLTMAHHLHPLQQTYFILMVPQPGTGAFEIYPGNTFSADPYYLGSDSFILLFMGK
jgi:hypothetical protein